MPRTIVVFTMHRSMSSLLGSMFVDAGYSVGRTPIPPGPDNKDGFFENLAIVRFNESWFKHLNTSWRNPISDERQLTHYKPGLIMGAFETLQLQFSASDNWLIKDPRLAFTYLDIWEPVFTSLVERRLEFIVIYRHPISVAHSLYRRNKLRSVESYALYVQTYLRIFDIVSNQKAVYIKAEDILEEDAWTHSVLHEQFALTDPFKNIRREYVTSQRPAGQLCGPLGDIYAELERRASAQRQDAGGTRMI